MIIKILRVKIVCSVPSNDRCVNVVSFNPVIM